jgi:hypothetical protein
MKYILMSMLMLILMLVMYVYDDDVVDDDDVGDDGFSDACKFMISPFSCRPTRGSAWTTKGPASTT